MLNKSTFRLVIILFEFFISALSLNIRKVLILSLLRGGVLISDISFSSNIDDLSNSGLIQDSLKVYWRHSTSDIWQSGLLDQFSNSDTHEEWIGYIPALTNEETIEYFITAADGSGRYEKNPPAGWHSFLAGRTEICDTWLNGDLDNSGQIDVIDVLLLTDLMDAAIDGICISSVSDLNDDSQLTYFDVYTLANQIIFGS